MFLPHPRVKVSIVGSLRDREVACSASDRQGSNFESCVWRTVSSHSSHHPQEVLLAQFSLYVHKGGLKPDSFHFISSQRVVSFREGQLVQSLARGALSMSLAAVRFRILLGAGFSKKYHVSPLSILGHCFDVVSLGKALNPQLLHLTQVKMSTW